ncbi:hypothetical protein ACPUER_18425, partial [Burkholderia sp. DN3021]|uniref:hypothetical protein n=1 Tax=Burkholderia sp. DN3021 TaxID=3410137 RepID=UPI003C7AE71E
GRIRNCYFYARAVPPPSDAAGKARISTAIDKCEGWPALQVLCNANKIYLAGLIEPSHKKVYRIVDSSSPELADHIVEHVYEDDPEREAELDRRYRCRATWWPSADQTLNAAMIAMVRTRTMSRNADI